MCTWSHLRGNIGNSGLMIFAQIGIWLFAISAPAYAGAIYFSDFTSYQHSVAFLVASIQFAGLFGLTFLVSAATNLFAYRFIKQQRRNPANALGLQSMNNYKKAMTTAVIQFVTNSSLPVNHHIETLPFLRTHEYICSRTVASTKSVKPQGFSASQANKQPVASYFFADEKKK